MGERFEVVATTGIEEHRCPYGKCPHHVEHLRLQKRVVVEAKDRAEALHLAKVQMRAQPWEPADDH